MLHTELKSLAILCSNLWYCWCTPPWTLNLLQWIRVQPWSSKASWRPIWMNINQSLQLPWNLTITLPGLRSLLHHILRALPQVSKWGDWSWEFVGWAEEGATHHLLLLYIDIAFRNTHLSCKSHFELFTKSSQRLMNNIKKFIEWFADELPMSSCVCPTGKCSWEKVLTNPAPTSMAANSPKMPFFTSSMGDGDYGPKPFKEYWGPANTWYPIPTQNLTKN